MKRILCLLLAGIMLDTKNFTIRTGERTFEAAAFLRRAGADTTTVQRLFQNDLSDMVSRYDIIRQAELYREDIAVAAVEEDGVEHELCVGDAEFCADGHTHAIRNNTDEVASFLALIIQDR